MWSGAFGDILVEKFIGEFGVDAMKQKASPGSDPIPADKATRKVDFNGFRQSFVLKPP